MLTVLGTAFVCSLIAIAVAVNSPKKYQAWALIENPAHAGHAPRLSKLRGELIAQEHDFETRWQMSREQAAARVIESTELKPQPEGLLVTVTTMDPKDSHRIARSVAESLGSPQHESALIAKWPSLSGITTADAKDLIDMSQLEYLLHDQSIKAGFESYAKVLQQATGGDEKAITFVSGEDFERRHAMLQDLTRKLGFDLRPGESVITAYNPGKVGPIPMVPMTGTIELIKFIGRLGGLAAGGLIVVALLRWKPEFLRPAPRKLPPPPAWSASQPTSNNEPW